MAASLCVRVPQLACSGNRFRFPRMARRRLLLCALSAPRCLACGPHTHGRTSRARTVLFSSSTILSRPPGLRPESVSPPAPPRIAAFRPRPVSPLSRPALPPAPLGQQCRIVPTIVLLPCCRRVCAPAVVRIRPPVRAASSHRIAVRCVRTMLGPTLICPSSAPLAACSRALGCVCPLPPLVSGGIDPRARPVSTHCLGGLALHTTPFSCRGILLHRRTQACGVGCLQPSPQSSQSSCST